MNIAYELGFRIPMWVENRLVFPGGLSYPLCPRCKITMERDYQRFCDRCGQKLAWKSHVYVRANTNKQG